MICISHNVRHACPVGDAFTILDRGRTCGTFQKREPARGEKLARGQKRKLARGSAGHGVRRRKPTVGFGSGVGRLGRSGEAGRGGAARSILSGDGREVMFGAN